MYSLQKRSGAIGALAAVVIGGLTLLPLGCDGSGSGSQTKGSESTASSAQPASESADSGPVITAAARKEAVEIFKTRCAACHGQNGAGDGPASAGLSPKPRNFTDAHWQDSVSDKHIETIIVYGGAAVGRSPAMPANPDLNGKPAVVAALREYVRGLRKQ